MKPLILKHSRTISPAAHRNKTFTSDSARQGGPQPAMAGRIIRFYADGFRSMTLGRTLWRIIIIKLLIMFAVLKLFFFPDFLKTNFANDTQRAAYVLDQITPPVKEKPNINKEVTRYD